MDEDIAQDSDVNRTSDSLGDTTTAARDNKMPPKKALKRAARACVTCRARKVRCDVLQGAPCGNCRWDDIDCVVQENRRWSKPSSSNGARRRRGKQGTKGADQSNVQSQRHGQGRSLDCDIGEVHERDSQPKHMDGTSDAGLLQLRLPSGTSSSLRDLIPRVVPTFDTQENTKVPQLPSFIKPLPPNITDEDVRYMHTKGALTLPSMPMQSALLRAFIEFVYPGLPLLDLQDFLRVIESVQGQQCTGHISILLYQAIMFAGSAFVDLMVLRDGGFSSRRSARRCLFRRTKLLYDLECESDRLIIVQALLLMTYWYETPDEQRDQWHWISAAVSLAHTIGLHRDPAATGMPLCKQRLWKRVWWCCYLRDRLISLGFRRPTHITDENYDIPMLSESDFEIEALPASQRQDKGGLVPTGCTMLHDTSMQLELAAICVAMTKLCTCVGKMLRVYDDSRMNKKRAKLETLQSATAVDFELMAWAEALPASCRYQPLTQFHVYSGRSATVVQRAMLHMIYYATISALHRTQFLASSPSAAPQQARNVSRVKVHNATTNITRIAAELYELRLEKFLPTYGVTAILPAMIVQLLELKSLVPQSGERAARGFLQCMRVLKSLRETYAAADHAVVLLEASLKNASIDLNAIAAGLSGSTTISMTASHPDQGFGVPTPPPENGPYMTSYEALFNPKPTHCLSLQTTPEVLTKDGDATTLDLDLGGVSGVSPGNGNGNSAPELDFLSGLSDINWGALGMVEFGSDPWFKSPLDAVHQGGFVGNLFGEWGGDNATQN